MINVEVQAGGLEVYLRGVAEALSDLTPAWAEIHDVLLRFEEVVFASEGKYASADWVPLSPRYAAWKLRTHGALPILQLDGALVKSLTIRDDPAHVFRSAPTWAEFGTRVRYARAHQSGWPPANLPARPPIPPITREQGEAIGDVILGHVLKEAADA